MDIEEASKKVMKDYDKTFRDLAKYDNDEKPFIETYERNYDTLFAVLLVIVIIGFIAGEIFIRTL